MRKAEVWKTSDGEIFDDEQMAYNHERYLIVYKHLSLVFKSVFTGTALEFMEEKFIGSYEVLKLAIHNIEHELKQLTEDDVDEQPIDVREGIHKEPETDM